MYQSRSAATLPPSYERLGIVLEHAPSIYDVVATDEYRRTGTEMWRRLSDWTLDGVDPGAACAYIVVSGKRYSLTSAEGRALYDQAVENLRLLQTISLAPTQPSNRAPVTFLHWATLALLLLDSVALYLILQRL